MDVEQRARELLAAEYEKAEMEGVAAAVRIGSHDNDPEFLAIIAALTPPEGYVLVPRIPTPEMQDAVESMKLPHALLRTGVRLADFRERYAAMLVARPLVNRSEMEP